MTERMSRWIRASGVTVLAVAGVVVGTAVLIGFLLFLNVLLFHIPLSTR
jgi:ABC-type Fe3+ transport system permease subunit